MKSIKPEAELILKILALSLLVLIIAGAFWIFGYFFIPENTVETVSDANKTVTVVLDAGHGGNDPGANVGGVCEKDLNLQMVMKIKEFLELYNFEVVLTRNDDSLLADAESKNKKRDDLLNRVKLVKKYSDPIFVSIHMNKFPESRYCGLQVFYSVNARYSEALALSVQGNNKRFLEQDNNRNVKKADSSIYVLDRIMSPAILIECGFLSNDGDRTKLTDDEYQNKLAFVIANSIVEYYRL